ncbi:MAG: lipocalin-like domain-containing protein [Acidobacteria bacterium]|nr:lipocalin-like domain-containing protein [Acidobacteriota bacterium]
MSFVTRSAMRDVKSVLIVVVMLSPLTALGLRAGGFPSPGPVAGEAFAQTLSERARLVGTYRLVGREVKDEDGTWRPTPNFNEIGYITYSDTGYMGVQVMPNARAPFAGDQPTADEARTALQGYSAYYGPFSTDEDEDGTFVVHHRVGQIDPGGEVDAKRFYDFDGDRLILTPATPDGRKVGATRHVVWERLPEVPLSNEARRFVGFRQLLYTDRYTERDGRLVSHGERNESRAGSYIIYTPTGHMMVHLMAREGRTPYAGTTPTPDEALAAYQSYGGYFGRFTVHDDDDSPYVVHHQEGRPRPGPLTDAVRLYELDGNVLRLGGRPRMSAGEATGGHLYWEMLPARPE